MGKREFESRKEHAFDNYCKKVMRNEVRDIYREWNRLHRLEIPISALTYEQLAELFTSDDYFAGERVFNMDGMQLIVDDDDIADALEQLTEQRREIILRYYFLDLNDREIAEKLNLLRATVQYQRKRALEDLRAILEDLL